MQKVSNYELKASLKTVSPVAIIEGNDNESNGNIVTRIKRRAVIVENDEGKKIDYVPYLPANGVRGLLRRLASKKLIEAVKTNENVTELNDSDLHAMLSGSGVAKNTLKAKDVALIREKNPLLSLFGTGIIAAGKLKVADVVPSEDTAGLSLIKRYTFAKVDDILSKTAYSALFTKEQIAEWEKAVDENSSARKEDREAKKLAKEQGEAFDEKNKTKKTSIQHYAQKEYIAVNAKFVGGFYLEGATSLELGLFLHALEDFANLGKLGSSQNIGFGVVDIRVEALNGEATFDRIADENYIFNAKIEKDLSGEYKKAYDEYSEFLKKATRDNIEVISKL